MEDHLVSKSNKVIEATYKLGLNEQRILLSCISKQNSKSKMREGKEFTLSAKEYSDLFGMSIKNAYREIRSASDTLFERHLWITNSSTGNPIKTRWISSIEYLEGEGEITLQFAEKVIPFLANLSREFTSYRLGNIAQFKSIYAIRLYEMFAQWERKGELTISMENLRKRLGIQDSEYKRIDHFKRRVINTAVEQINKYTDINCCYEQKKSGKKITGFKFYFGEDCPNQLELEDAIADLKK